jgi:hypothetical protein
MPHMLSMAAGQIGHPITLFIQMIADNGLVHKHSLTAMTDHTHSFLNRYIETA